MSQLQHRNENQNFISNFVLQFIKKTKWHFRYTDSLCFVKQQGLESLSFQNISAFQIKKKWKIIFFQRKFTNKIIDKIRNYEIF